MVMVIKKYQKIFDEVVGDAQWRYWMRRIEENPLHSYKLCVDHGRDHVYRVYGYALRFLLLLRQFRPELKVSDEDVYFALFATMLHDIGLATNSKAPHAKVSAELAREYLTKFKALDQFARNKIVHAIANHSNSDRIVSPIDAALLLGDKMDVSRERYTDPRALKDPDMGELIGELRKVQRVDFDVEVSKDKTVARLIYTTDPLGDIMSPNHGEFNPAFFHLWPKAITVPRDIALSYLKADEFYFVVNHVRINIDNI